MKREIIERLITVVFVILFFCSLSFGCIPGLVNLGVGSLKLVENITLSTLSNLLLLFPNEYKMTYKNWAGVRIVPNLWKLTPKTAEDVVAITNFAYRRGLRVRALGKMHTWSPLTVLDKSDVEKVILVDMKKHLTKMEITSRSGSSAIVKIQTGAAMVDIMEFLEKNSYGLLVTPATGDITLGGVIAINGHGSSIPAAGERLEKGHSYGSISNLIVSLTAVVWDSLLAEYVLKTFKREDKESKAFLTNLGKTFLTEVELRVGPLLHLRCVSYVDIEAEELFADPASVSPTTKTFASFLEESGRVETILFPFTSKPWLKVWSVTPEKPKSSREVPGPYNYIFSDLIPELLSLLYGQIQSGIVHLAPLLGQLSYTITQSGLILNNLLDIWGPAKNTLLYVRPTTLRLNENGYAIITTRANIQHVLNTVYLRYKLLVQEFQRHNEYPVNGPLEIRVTGLDNPEDVGVTGAESPTLSALGTDNENPQFDVAVWVSVLTIPGTRMANKFLKMFETFLLKTFNKGNGKTMVRPEWAKGWAYTDQGPWLNKTVLYNTIPNSIQAEGNPENGWAWALSILHKYDPGNVFTNEFLIKFMAHK